MSKVLISIWLSASLILLAGCETASLDQDGHAQADGHADPAAEPEKGPHRGRILRNGDFELELSIFETGVPPEFRVWVSKGGSPLAPEEVDLQVRLIRLGDQVDEIGFAPQEDFLRGDSVIYEPHSFVVSISARHGSAKHEWQYDNFEGRTRIGADVAEAFGLETEIAGPKVINETINVYGRIVPNAERVRQISARFDGSIQWVGPALGDTVKKGAALAKIESNESLNAYMIEAPISGVISERAANPGEQTNGRQLFTIMDTATVWLDLSIFPKDRSRVKVGAEVAISPADGGAMIQGSISRIDVVSQANQSVIARAVLDNPDGLFVAGSHVAGQVKVAEHPVQLAVKKTGLQAFRDFTVVYAQIGDEYEVRMLDLGRESSDWIEVLGGLDPGTRYVSENSYLVKADIEKSGASHDH